MMANKIWKLIKVTEEILVHHDRFMKNKPSELQSQLELQRRQVDVENYDLSIGELYRMTQQRELIRAPEYQRKFRWNAGDESHLIESLLLGLPVPSIYVASNPDGTWEVVDGLQRISTIIHFMTDSPELLGELEKPTSLRLEGLQKLPAFNNHTYDQLPTPIKLQFARRPLRVTSLSDKSDPEIRFDVFERLNRGGVTLTPQEVRACIYRGPLANLLRELAEDEEYKRLVKLQAVHQHDGTREEIALKFFAYLGAGDKYDGDVTNFLNRYMRENSKDFDVTRGRDLFIRVVRRLLEITHGPLLRKGYSVTPINQLEAVMVAAGRLLQSRDIGLKPPPDWLNDKTLIQHSTKGTNTRAAFRARNERAQELLSTAPL